VYLAQLDEGTAHLPPELRADLEPHVARVRAQRAGAHRALLESIAGPRYRQMTAEFARYLDEGPSAAALRRSRGVTAREGAEQFALRALKRARKAGRNIAGDSRAERQHQLRLRCKRLRYLLESFEPLYGEQLDGAIRSLKRVQDGLGELRDVSAAAERLRAQANNATESALPDASADERVRCRIACQMLMHLQQAEAVHAQQRFERSWRQFEERVRKKRLRRALRRPKRTATRTADTATSTPLPG
jgi:CHAD domain-containing protein